MNHRKAIDIALKNAISSVEIEGYNISKTQKEISLHFLKGDLSKEEFIKLALKECKQ